MLIDFELTRNYVYLDLRRKTEDLSRTRKNL